MLENPYECYFPIPNEDNINRLKSYLPEVKKYVTKDKYENFVSVINFLSGLDEKYLHGCRIKLSGIGSSSLSINSFKEDFTIPLSDFQYWNCSPKIYVSFRTKNFFNLSSNNTLWNSSMGMKGTIQEFSHSYISLYCTKELTDDKEYFYLKFKSPKTRYEIVYKSSKKLILGIHSKDSSFKRKFLKYVKELLESEN